MNATSTPSDMPRQFFDIAMQCISKGLGRMKYHRSPIGGKCFEVAQCSKIMPHTPGFHYKCGTGNTYIQKSSHFIKVMVLLYYITSR